jgi:RimJ/RimL family protein N-acetyltransferase
MGGRAMIEGKLVRLRAPDMSDLDRYYAWINDREVTRHLIMRYPTSRDAEEAWLQGHANKPLSYDHVWFAVDTKEGAHIGGINFHVVRPENRNARLGIMIGDKNHWSQGYGTDAMLTLLRFGFDEMNLHRIDLTVDAANPRAVRCYQKCGFVEEGRLRDARYTGGQYGDQLIMSILRDEFYDRWGATSG